MIVLPASTTRTLHSGISDNLLATTAPADPPPTTIKSYSTDIGGLGLGRPQGSSKSHWDLRKTSRRPMKSMNGAPPHVAASVGPGWVTGQLQGI